MVKFSRKLSVLFLIFYFIMMDEICNNSIINIFEDSSHPIALIFAFLMIQAVAAPIQAGYSDFYCRKKSLIASLSISIISLAFALILVSKCSTSWIVIMLMILVKGLFGNTLPIAWAGLADTKMKDFRFSVGFATIGMAGGYLVLSFLQKLFSPSNSIVASIALVLLGVLLCMKFFVDIRDRDVHKKGNNSIKKEVTLIFTDFLMCKRFRRALIAFLLWELSFYFVFILDVDMHLEKFKFLSLTMIVGWITGVLILKFAKGSDTSLIKYGFHLSIWSLVVLIAIRLSHNGSHSQTLILFFAYSIGCGFLVPSLFSILSKERKAHEQGKIYGLIDSIDSIAFLLAAILGIVYNSGDFRPIYVFSISFLILLVSVHYYVRFLKSNPRRTPST